MYNTNPLIESFGGVRFDAVKLDSMNMRYMR